MISTESELWVAIKAWADEAGVFAERFEDRTRAGVPDCNINGHWVELKIGDEPYRRGQLAWALSAGKRGQSHFTLRARGDKVQLLHTPTVAKAVLFSERGAAHIQGWTAPLSEVMEALAEAPERPPEGLAEIATEKSRATTPEGVSR